MELSSILDPRAVRVVASANSKKRLLQEICDQANTVYGLESSTLLSSLLEREALGSTGVGRGVAIPHARIEGLDRVYGLFTRLERPVDFESLDKQSTDLIFTILAPTTEGAEHLKALALVSRTFRSEDICAKLRANNEAKTLYSILTETISHKAA